MTLILKFNQISEALARDCVKKHQNASYQTIKDVYPNAKLSEVFENPKLKFFSVAFLMDDEHGHSQDHLQGMLRVKSREEVKIMPNGSLPDERLYDSYRFYAGIDEYNEAVCILAFAKRHEKPNRESDRYVDVDGYYYAHHCEINDPNMHPIKSSEENLQTILMNHLSCNPHCDGVSLP
jgi:hypothetical protein